MANFRYGRWADNVAPNATLSTSATENSAYPLSFATDFSFENLANPARLVETSGDLIADFGAAQQIDYVLLWTNWLEDLEFSVQMNATDSWGAPTLDYSGVAPAKRGNGYTRKIGIDLTPVTGYSPLQFLRINASGANDEPIGLKFLAFSQMRVLDRNIKWGLNLDLNVFNIRMRTDAGHPWNYDVAAAPRQLRGDIDATAADDEALDDWILSLGGSAYPTVVVKDWPDGEPFLGFFGDGSLGPKGAGIDVLKFPSKHTFIDRRLRTIILDEVTAVDPEWD